MRFITLKPDNPWIFSPSKEKSVKAWSICSYSLIHCANNLPTNTETPQLQSNDQLTPQCWPIQPKRHTHSLNPKPLANTLTYSILQHALFLSACCTELIPDLYLLNCYPITLSSQALQADVVETNPNSPHKCISTPMHLSYQCQPMPAYCLCFFAPPQITCMLPMQLDWWLDHHTQCPIHNYPPIYLSHPVADVPCSAHKGLTWHVYHACQYPLYPSTPYTIVHLSYPLYPSCPSWWYTQSATTLTWIPTHNGIPSLSSPHYQTSLQIASAQFCHHPAHVTPVVVICVSSCPPCESLLSRSKGASPLLPAA